MCPDDGCTWMRERVQRLEAQGAQAPWGARPGGGVGGFLIRLVTDEVVATSASEHHEVQKCRKNYCMVRVLRSCEQLRPAPARTRCQRRNGVSQQFLKSGVHCSLNQPKDFFEEPACEAAFLAGLQVVGALTSSRTSNTVVHNSAVDCPLP